jgi:hypothetical protein
VAAADLPTDCVCDRFVGAVAERHAEARHGGDELPDVHGIVGVGEGDADGGAETVGAAAVTCRHPPSVTKRCDVSAIRRMRHPDEDQVFVRFQRSGFSLPCEA